MLNHSRFNSRPTVFPYFVFALQREINHDALGKYLQPLRELLAEVKKKALQRLEYEGLKECELITAPGGKFYKDPTGFALSKYAYYMCFKCNKVAWCG